MISVIICSHNPREDYLGQTLDALMIQSLDRKRWELIVVDNASAKPLSSISDVSWHSHARHVQESELGLTSARMRGIREAKGDLIVFVDDDNVLINDYLEKALSVFEANPDAGAWSGSCRPEFETTPPSWSTPYLYRLALMEVHNEQWTFKGGGLQANPIGAGMCVRREVAQYALRRWAGVDEARRLDRRGDALSGHGDADLAHCALDLGFKIGRSPLLNLTHLIGANRLTLDYFVRHAEADAVSDVMFRSLRGIPVEPPPPLRKPTWRGRIRRLIYGPNEQERVNQAQWKGFLRGVALARQIDLVPSDAGNS
jgi:glycosyltransferase involved in cell wall biosynthesis